jgi:hypothetical protein
MIVLLLVRDEHTTVLQKLQAFQFAIAVQHFNLIYCSTHTSEFHMAADGEKL